MGIFLTFWPDPFGWIGSNRIFKLLEDIRGRAKVLSPNLQVHLVRPCKSKSTLFSFPSGGWNSQAISKRALPGHVWSDPWNGMGTRSCQQGNGLRCSMWVSSYISTAIFCLTLTPRPSKRSLFKWVNSKEHPQISVDCFTVPLNQSGCSHCHCPCAPWPLQGNNSVLPFTTHSPSLFLACISEWFSYPLHFFSWHLWRS